PRLFTFFNQVLAQLVTKDSLLPVHVYEYLMQRWEDIKGISSRCSMNSEPSLQSLEKIVNEYRQFSELLRMFECIRCNYLFECDLSDRLKELSDSWKAQGFASVKEKYKNEIQLLKSCEQKMKITLERSKSLMFNKIWKNYNAQCKSIRDQIPLFIFNKIFDDMNNIWENLKQGFQNGLKYQDLEWIYISSDGIKKSLIDEMEYLFPDYNEKQRQEIANDVEKKLKKEIDLKEQLPSWIELKKVTEQMKEYHPQKDRIKEDEKWQKYVKALAQWKDISIEQTFQYYNTCIECVREGAKPCVDIGLFDILNRCKDKLKILVENQNFNDEAHFENTLNVLSKSKDNDIQGLATSLRCANSTMQNTLWKCPLEDMTSLAKAILKLHLKGQEFVKMISKYKIRTETSLRQLKDAM
ncbi:hypothetical protein RFI_04584, partial [Reticulomyxa filosa]